jgi:C-terminal processing protease CtpA/Prc
MTSARTPALALSFLCAAAGFASAQDEKLKRDLLREVEKRLKAEEERLLKDIERAVDEELAKRPAAPAAPAKKPRGFLGVRCAELTDEERKELGIQGGIRVVEAVPQGPAAQAGVKADDVIVSFDGRSLDSPQEIPVLVQGAGPGAKVKIEVLRGGERKTLTATLAPHPADAAPGAAPEQGKAEDELRERIKKLVERKKEGQAPAPFEPKDAPKAKPKAAPKPQDDDFFAFDENTFEQFRALFEQFGVDPEQFFEKGDDGRYRFGGDFKELFKNFNFERFKELLPKFDLPKEEAPAPAPRKAEPRKTAPSGPRPWLGLQPEEVSDDLRAQLDLPEGRGLLVGGVVAESPAEKAGVKRSDILLKLDGKAVGGEADLAAFMKAAKPGQEVVLTLLRKGKEITVRAVVGTRSE